MKDHPVLAPVIVVAIILGAVAVFIVQLDDVRKVFWPTQDPTPPTTITTPPSPSEVTPAPVEAPAKPPAPDPVPSAASVAKQDRIFVHCQYGVMPSTVPPEGGIYVLVTSDLPREMGGGGLANYFGQPGSQWKWSNDGLPVWAYRCELTNYTKDVLFNLPIPVRLIFRTPLPVEGQDKARKQGDVTLDRFWTFSVPKLDPSPAQPYEFYTWNCCVQKFVQVALPPQLVTTDDVRIPLIQSEGNLFQPLNPVPFN